MLVSHARGRRGRPDLHLPPVPAIPTPELEVQQSRVGLSHPIDIDETQFLPAIARGAIDGNPMAVIVKVTW